MPKTKYKRRRTTKHTLPGGRTGAKFTKQTKSKKKYEYQVTKKQTIPRSIEQLLGSLKKGSK